MSLDTIRFGLFGTGSWAVDVHGAALAAEPAVDLVGVWGRNAEKASAAADRLGVRPYADVDRLIGDVDAIAVALPPDVQAKIAERAARAGRHLLLDKPLALDLPAADAVVDAVSETGVASVVFFTVRFMAATARWLDETVAAGPWEGLRGAWLSAFLHPGETPPWNSPWREERGALWDVGPHALSVAIPLLGDVSEVVAARGLRDTVHLALEHTSGGSSTLTLSLTAPPAATTVDFAVYGARGWRTMPWTQEPRVDAMRNAVRQLIESAGGSGEHECGVRFARDVVAILDRAQALLALAGSGRPNDG